MLEARCFNSLFTDELTDVAKINNLPQTRKKVYVGIEISLFQKNNFLRQNSYNINEQFKKMHNSVAVMCSHDLYPVPKHLYHLVFIK